MIPILDSKRQYAAIGTVEKAVCEVLRSGSYILGPNTKALEQELADFIGCKYTVGLNSGTDALHLALRALDIGAGDEVITVAFTFVATTEAIGIVGAKPVFVDIDKEEQLKRIEKRNGKEQVPMFVNRWIPMEEAYFKEFQVKENCRLLLRQPMHDQ